MDDESAAAELPPHDPHLLLYDYFKHLSSLVLFALGGLLLVLKDFDARDARPQIVAACFLMISMSGILAFGGSWGIVRCRLKGKPMNREVIMAQWGAPILLALGLGLFLAIFLHKFFA